MVASLDKDAKKKSYKYEFQYKGQRYHKRGFPTKQEAIDAENDIKFKLRNGIYYEDIEENFNDYIQNWLDRRTDLGDNTMATYQSYLKLHVKPFFQGRKIDTIKPIDIQKFLDYVKDKGLSGGTQEKAYTLLNKCFNDTVRLELLTRNPVNGVDKPKRSDEKEIEVLDADELQEFLAYAEQTTRYWFAFKLLAYTGMRRGELLALTWDDIDLDNKKITINKRLVKEGKKNNSYVQRGTKTGKDRTVTISNQLKLDVTKHKELQDIEKSENDYEDNNLVIATSIGTYVYVDNLTRAFRQTLKNSPIEKKMTMHDLRHTHATLLLKAGVQMKVVSERLGHAGIKTTMDIYSHLLPSMEEEAANKFEELFD